MPTVASEKLVAVVPMLSDFVVCVSAVCQSSVLGIVVLSTASEETVAVEVAAELFETRKDVVLSVDSIPWEESVELSVDSEL